MRYQLNLFVLAKISLWTLAMGSRLGTWHMALPHKGMPPKTFIYVKFLSHPSVRR